MPMTCFAIDGRRFTFVVCFQTGMYREGEVLIGQLIVVRYEVKNQTEACEGPQEDSHW